ncbi:TetR family transcriptional regulator [Secundilactobacillus pentosiphilus]|uniref:TetR family transcriptional regulator n=1 Tax=Secundilactobacillus pentosiphilus TaxID=1714682 RepID=A0A1Z5IXB6_9LACO|nr:TetR/AcrR family transcriptional regulator [Secundilactobacillus pentosiphilus]GAX06306.1 TetR family transcriptional regulator [Secundilactobacillus pentosiphilus]
MKHTDVETLFANNIKATSLSAKQRKVLQASLTLFAQKGYENTSTLDIAHLAGVSEGTVFKHFKTKDGLRQAILKPFLHDIFPKVAGEFLVTLHQNPFENFESFLRYAVKDRMVYAMDNRQEMKIFIQEMVKDPSIMTSLTKRLSKLLQSGVDSLFREYKERGELVDWDSMRIVRLASGVIVGYLIPNIIMSDTPLDVDKTTDEVCEFLLDGLKPRECDTTR